MPASVEPAAAPAAFPAPRAWLLGRALASLPTRDPYAIIGLTIYALFALVALAAGLIAPHDPFEILFRANGRLAANLAPSGDFPLGTTSLGRDIFSQLVYGARSALTVGVTAAIAVVALGSLVGVVSGYFGGLVDQVLMRLTDVTLSMPFLPSVIVLTAFLGTRTSTVVFAVIILLWPNTARVIRAQVLSIRERAYIEAARVVGSSDLAILVHHVVPSILPLSLLYGSIAVGWAILTEASISFLGFGDAETTSWGHMLQDAFSSQALSRGQYHWFVPPGLCIVLITVAGFFISRGYEALLFPKLRD